MTIDRLRRPEEGWLTLALVLVMCLVLASAIDDPAWVNGRGALTDGLVWLAAAGVAVGFVGPKVGWGRWTTHGIGALFAGLLIPIVAGLSMGDQLPQAFHHTAAGTVQAYLDLAWRGLEFTNQEVHYLLVLGIVVWGTSQFASYAVFGHRHPLNAVMMAGIVLVANAGSTFNDQVPYLVAFTTASLFLLIEMHAFDERATWVRRRIGDPATISSLYLRGGTVFILVAMLGSLLLMNRAASDPLAGAWTGVSARLVEMSDTIGRLLPVGGNFRGTGAVVFGDAARIPAQWTSGNGVAFTATIPPEAPKVMYWRAKTYNQYLVGGLGGTWAQTGITEHSVDAGQPLLAGSYDVTAASLTTPLQIPIQTDAYLQPLLLSPGTPLAVGVHSTVRVSGTQQWFAAADIPFGTGGYTVDTRVQNLEGKPTAPGTITGNRLVAASESYPKDLQDLYTGIPTGAIGPAATNLLAQILARSPTDDPYDIATTMADYLADGKQFTYDPDLRDDPCDSDSTVECFARTHHGFCLQFASTMAILMRAARPSDPIPTRLVQGFLPGKRVGSTETVEMSNAHAWVEVFFPGYGWIRFDPTGHGIGREPEIQLGPKVPAATPGPVASDPGRGPDPLSGAENGGTGPVPPSGRGGPGDRTLLILLTVVVALVVGGVALAAWLRGPRGEVTPDRAWVSLSRVASRLGFGPRPTQTVYEYAASLGDLVPIARADLATVAEAKVETTYARVRLGGERLDGIARASRRLRVSLLRLAFRRGRRRRPGR